MKNQVMIKNLTSFSMDDVYDYISGFTHKLENKIIVDFEEGQNYDVIMVTEIHEFTAN